MAATIKDIAKLAHVSIATVSRILSDRTESHTEETIARVRKAAKELAYQKNTAAIELVTKKSNVVAVIVSATPTNFSNQIIDGIQKKAAKHHLAVIILYAGENNTELQRKALQTVAERSVMGILLLAINLSPANLKFLTKSTIPFVFLALSFQDKTIPFIASDDFQIAYQATNFLISKGHRKIGLAAADFHISYTGYRRLAGYQKAMQEHQLQLVPDWVQDGNYSYQSGRRAIQAYMKNTQVTAVIANSDLAAMGIANQALDFGLSIPNDLSIISIDGTDFCTMFRPQLTSMTQSFYEMGSQGIDCLLNRKLSTAAQRFTAVSIQERESVKNI
ncbi:Catabolite control protein A [Oenococcus sicerae]|nr:Catabolite control protein A [Oenococcus sicerae]